MVFSSAMQLLWALLLLPHANINQAALAAAAPTALGYIRPVNASACAHCPVEPFQCDCPVVTMRHHHKHRHRFRLAFFSKFKKHHSRKPTTPPDTVPGNGEDEEGDSPEETVGPDDPLEFWIRIGMVGFLLCVSALMSGLTIGLMSLDTNNLAILKRCGTPQQQKYAAAIEPLRKRTHLLLCTLLIGNMLATETLPIILDDLFGGGWKAIVVSTVLVVVFGEIIPQAICSVHALKIGYYTSWLVRFLMILMYPIAGPFALLLTWVLGNAEGVIYRRAGTLTPYSYDNFYRIEGIR